MFVSSFVETANGQRYRFIGCNDEGDGCHEEEKNSGRASQNLARFVERINRCRNLYDIFY